MIITCKKGAPQHEVDKLIRDFESKGLEVNLITGTNYNVYGLTNATKSGLSCK